MELTTSAGINSKVKFHGPVYQTAIRVRYWALPEFPTCDTYRIKVDSEEYTCDSSGDDDG